MTVLSTPTAIDQMTAGGTIPSEDCGETCLVSVLRDAGNMTITVRDLETLCSGCGAVIGQGTVEDSLVSVLKTEGVPSHPVSGAIREFVDAALSRRHRCIALINVIWDGEPSRPGQGTFLHWVEVFGHDAGGYHVMNPIPVRNDPANGMVYVYDAGTFEGAAAGRGVEIDTVFPRDNQTPVPTWQTLGGRVEGGLVCVPNEDGRLEVVARGTDGQVYHRYQMAPNGQWSKTWEALGGQIKGHIVALRNVDKRIALFARGKDNALWHVSQVQANKGWSTWTSLGGRTARPFAGAHNADGRLEIFTRGTDEALWHTAQEKAGGGWSPWSSLQGQVYGPMASIRSQDGRLTVFTRDQHGTAQLIRQSAPGRWDGSSWTSLNHTVASLLAVAQNANGQIVVFADGADHALYHTHEQSPGGPFAGWSSLGGGVYNVLRAFANRDGRLDVFTRGKDNALWHIHQLQPGGSWSQWASLGGRVADLLAVGMNEDGRLEVFVRGDDHGIWRRPQASPGKWE